MKVDLYSSIHKAQRRRLFELSVQIGLADPTDATQVAQIQQALEAIVAHLKDHSVNEENYIHPLFAEIGACGSTFEEDHRELERKLDGLRTLAQGHWRELYRAFNRFIADYLDHIEEEESAQAEILWERFDNPRLSAVFARFKRERPPTMAAADLEFMLPALSVPEIIGMFRGMKSQGPAATFEGACRIAEQALDPARWKTIQAAI